MAANTTTSRSKGSKQKRNNELRCRLNMSVGSGLSLSSWHECCVFGLPGGSVGKESTCNAGDLGSIPGLGSPGEGNGNPLQYSCLENPRDRGAWWATVQGITKSQT